MIIPQSSETAFFSYRTSRLEYSLSEKVIVSDPITIVLDKDAAKVAVKAIKANRATHKVLFIFTPPDFSDYTTAISFVRDHGI